MGRPEGEQMDMFMDKLAQKLTAQEIIKANTAADVAELNKLKKQTAEYQECLTQMQKLIDDGFGKLSGIQTNEEEITRLVGKGADGVTALQKNIKDFGGILSQLQGQVDSMDKAMAYQLEVVAKNLGDKIDQLCGQLEAQASSRLPEKLDAMEESVHKECVKVYRNVQAVMVEESGKQEDALKETKDEVTSLKGKIVALLGFCAGAMVFSLISVLVQVLARLNMLPF